MLSPLPESLLAWSSAVDAVRTGKTVWELAFGTGMFPLRRVVDVGGGSGQFFAALLPHDPQLRGVLFGQPSGLAGAKEVLASAGVLDR